VNISLRRFGVFIIAFLCIVFLCGTVWAGSKFSGEQRQDIIRALLNEHPYLHRALPSGAAGPVIEASSEGGKIATSEAELSAVLQHSGATAQAGERVLITGVRFLPNGILFEINGGPKRHKKWTEHLQIGMSSPGAMGTPNPQQPGAEVERQPGGTSVLLKLDETAGVDAERVKVLLAPVLDFNSKTQAEASQGILPPQLAAAVKDHRALVGMDRELVLMAVGRPPRRMRENSGGEQYEEWIYGTPPGPVQFIRFVRGKVVRIEEVNGSGEKVLRTEKEVGGLQSSATPVAATPRASGTNANADTGRATPPSLLRSEPSHPSRTQTASEAVEVPLPPSAPQPDGSK